MPRIEIILSPDGGVSVDAQGFKGKSCEEATAFIEKTLGEAKNYRKKPEYYARADAKQNTNVGR